jgi:hypothetical protein
MKLTSIPIYPAPDSFTILHLFVWLTFLECAASFSLLSAPGKTTPQHNNIMLHTYKHSDLHTHIYVYMEGRHNTDVAIGWSATVLNRVFRYTVWRLVNKWPIRVHGMVQGWFSPPPLQCKHILFTSTSALHTLHMYRAQISNTKRTCWILNIYSMGSNAWIRPQGQQKERI